MKLTVIILFLMMLLSALPANAQGDEVKRFMLEGPDVTIVYEEGLAKAASDIAKIYPASVDDLKGLLGAGPGSRPAIILINDRMRFERMAGSRLTVAYAIPEKSIIVLDSTRLYHEPFKVPVTLKHEVCHLVVYSLAGGRRPPRWLNEGVCQWASGGAAEILSGGESELTGAVIFGGLYGLDDLDIAFSSGDRSVLLAYQESKSIVEYIARKYGSGAVPAILQAMGRGDDLDAALTEVTGEGKDSLESSWRSSLRTGPALFYFLSVHFYEVLFLLTAMVTVCGFVRLVRKRRAYRDIDDDTDGGPYFEEGPVE